jgi:hypothetical protein
MHRKLVAQMAQLHLAPTAAAAAALAAEGVCDGVHVTGNSGIDALLLMKALLAGDVALAGAAVAPLAGIPRGRPWVLATIHRRENQGHVLGGLLDALAELAGEAEIILPVHPSPAVSGPLRAAAAAALCRVRRSDGTVSPCADRFGWGAGRGTGHRSALPGAARYHGAARGAVQRQCRAGGA